MQEDIFVQRNGVTLALGMRDGIIIVGMSDASGDARWIPLSRDMAQQMADWLSGSVLL